VRRPLQRQDAQPPSGGFFISAPALYFTMPSVKISVPHNLGTEEAKRRIQGLITDAKSKFGGQATNVRENWTNNRNDFGFQAMGMTVSGSMEVEPAAVNISVDLPFAAMLLKGKIEKEITDKARLLLT
jgi:hypothetical protein